MLEQKTEIKFNKSLATRYQIFTFFRLSLVQNLPNAFGGSDRTQSAEEHSKPCWMKTTGLGSVVFVGPSFP